MKLLITTLLACCLITFAVCVGAVNPCRAEGVNAMVVPTWSACADTAVQGWVDPRGVGAAANFQVDSVPQLADNCHKHH